jgi:hypothetical protein
VPAFGTTVSFPFAEHSPRSFVPPKQALTPHWMMTAGFDPPGLYVHVQLPTAPASLVHGDASAAASFADAVPGAGPPPDGSTDAYDVGACSEPHAMTSMPMLPARSVQSATCTTRQRGFRTPSAYQAGLAAWPINLSREKWPPCVADSNQAH